MEKRSPLLVVRVPLQGWSTCSTNHAAAAAAAPLASAEDLSRHNSPCVRYGESVGDPSGEPSDRAPTQHDTEDGALLLPLAHTDTSLQPVDRHVLVYQQQLKLLFIESYHLKTMFLLAKSETYFSRPSKPTLTSIISP